MDHLPLRFVKMSGAGNTFVLVAPEPELWASFQKQTQHSASEFAKMICDPILGIKADGFLVLTPGQDGVDYVWDFYNSDGSTAEMCGNAARCATRFAHELLSKKEKASFTFQAGAGVIEAKVLGSGLIRVAMPATRLLQESVVLKTDMSTEEFVLVDSGVPHAVQKIFSFKDAVGLKEMARAIRGHEKLKPAGANVTFYSVDNEKEIHAVTFERGVEDYTLACGTGAVAAAFVHRARVGGENVQVTMPGGNLRVYFQENNPRPLMEGEAVFVGEFMYSLEVFL